ncbi:hypothetical protein Aeqsu_0639 [Aequorivita sublithincola DSM 14238]|uniref:Uncharacterized protein n=1 Tax=Aequorivita sublithincola (strain DSM 14238 / LMG 21431 / ACAM 643 / 9-3) TaxID=746697 RepID=I3YT30_AEQSU|nr:hypothetical protein [Aequorivita sublithincola]AFL80148.1 hypothetical protein Aeqsu_0639 [Aequorivita sublithincola DSM 14238]
MEDREENRYIKIAELITASCRFDKRPSKEFQRFHQSFFNFYFNSIDLNIDYENNVISIWNSKPLTKNPVRLFDLNEAISDNVCYTNLEETLNGCLEEGHLQENFYKKLLCEFGDFGKDEKNNLSA